MPVFVCLKIVCGLLFRGWLGAAGAPSHQNRVRLTISCDGETLDRLWRKKDPWGCLDFWP